MNNIPIFKYDNIELFYITEGEGEPLVLLSGIGNKMGWIFQLPFFKEKMKVITHHYRGTGKSSRPNYPYSIEMFLVDIENLLDFLDIKEKIHLCGWSMGGMIAQHYVLKHPNNVKTLILCATTSVPPGIGLESTLKFHELIETYDPDQKINLYIASTFNRPFRKKLRIDNDLYLKIRNNFSEDPTTLQDFKNQAAAIKNHDTRVFLSKIMQPTLVLIGEKDVVLMESSRKLHEKIPNSRLEIIENSGHFFVMEESEKVNNLIWEFIKENL